MPILSGDVKLVESQNMDDVPEGGGPPTALVVPDGDSNNVFPDISESDRAGGRVRLRKLHLSVQTPDRDIYLGASVIVSRPPFDENVTISLFKAANVFDRRADAASRIENYLVPGPIFSGYLLERHVAGQSVLQIFQRVGAAPPSVGRTLVLVLNEGQPDELSQAVRTTRISTEERTFTEIVNGSAMDFLGQVTTCELSDKLRNNFPGSPASMLFAPQAGATVLRDTTVANAGSYFGVSPLALAASVGDTSARVQSVYTQLVPSARTESAAIDQRPASQRTLTLATSPRRVEIGVAPHSMRDKVGQENRSFNWVAMLKPLPAPGTVVISFRALGNWYTLLDDGAGNFTGSGSGTVNYLTGSVLVTLPSLPDAGSAVIYQWGENTAFANRSGQVGFRAPEYAFKLEHDAIKPGTVVMKWTSGGTLRTATDNGTGGFTGPATGEIDYASGTVFLRPTAMPDAGGEFDIDYERLPLVTKTVAAPSVDAGGFANIVLDTVPLAGTVCLRWITVRNVSNSSGATSGGTSSSKAAGSKTTVVQTPPGPTRPPALSTRVFAGLTNDGLLDRMTPCGTRTATGEIVFVAVRPTFEADGWGYSIPDAFASAVWNELDMARGSILVDTTTYYIWGRNPPPTPLGMA